MIMNTMYEVVCEMNLIHGWDMNFPIYEKSNKFLIISEQKQLTWQKLAYFRVWSKNVDYGYEGQKNDEETNEQEHEHVIHLGDLANARVPDLVELLLTVGVRDERLLRVLDGQVETRQPIVLLLGLLARLVEDDFELVATAHIVQQFARVDAQILG